MPSDDEFLAAAIAEATRGVQAGHGGPFGAVIVRAGEVLARGHNRVLLEADPTAHAEVVAIRAACRALGDHRLEGAVLYASCEPCPMCFCAISWARVHHVYYAATRHDAAAAGFDDAAFHEELARPLPERSLPLTHLDHPERTRPFDVFRDTHGRQLY